MESPSDLAASFMAEVKRLFEFFSQINSYLAQLNNRAPPISQTTLDLLLVAIGVGNGQMACHVADVFAERAIPYTDTIQARDVPKFCDIAPSLFPEVPRGTLDQIVSILRNDDPSFAETKDDVFAYVDCLLDLSVRRQVALGAEAGVSRDVLKTVVKKIPSIPPKYVSALGA